MAEQSTKAASLIPFFLHNTRSEGQVKSLQSQFEHRLELVSFWDITPGSRVLEIGCGQGDCTIVLADAVGENGHVDALDPGAPDYGSPYTLSQSQSHILTSPLSPRITFHNTDPISYLSSLSTTHQPYDYIILSHCIYYFSAHQPSPLPQLIPLFTAHTRKVCIAEWSLQASSLETFPHVLAVLLLATLESKRKSEKRGNVRRVISPSQIKSIITSPPSSSTSSSASFKLSREKTGKSNEGLLDAYWEVSDLLAKREKVLNEMENEGVTERELGALGAGYDAVSQSVVGLEGGERSVRCMDFWAGVFEV